MDSFAWLSSVREGLRERLRAVLGKAGPDAEEFARQRMRRRVRPMELLEPRQLMSVTGTISGASSVNEGSTYVLSLSASATSGSSVAGWSINWGDGCVQTNLSGSATQATHVYPDGLAYETISAIVFGSGGSGSSYSVSPKYVTVNNVAPTLSAEGTDPGGMDYSVEVAKVFDPGTDTVTHWTIDWGDSTTSNVTEESGGAEHTYQSYGDFTVVATAYDEDGSYAAGSLLAQKYLTLDVTNYDATGATTQNRKNIAAGDTGDFQAVVVKDQTGAGTTATLQFEVKTSGGIVMAAGFTFPAPAYQGMGNYKVTIAVAATVAPGDYNIKVFANGSISNAFIYIHV